MCVHSCMHVWGIELKPSQGLGNTLSLSYIPTLMSFYFNTESY